MYVFEIGFYTSLIVQGEMWNLYVLSGFVFCCLLSVSLTLANKIPYERRTFFSDRIHFPTENEELTPEGPRESGYSYPNIMSPKLTASQEDLAGVNHHETFESDGRMLPVELARQLSDLDSIRDMINQHFVDPEKILSMNSNGLSLQSRFGGEPSSEPDVKVTYPPFAICKALPEVVSLEPDHTLSNTIYVPPCTRVQRCSGCCLSDVLSCEPTEVEMRTFQVLEAKFFANVSKFKFVANREVQVEEHKDCRCACRMKEEECNEKQKFEESRCKCYCRNTDEELQCTSRVHRWDEESCRCVCLQELSCTGTRHFDTDLCRCVRGKGRKNNLGIVDIS